MNPSKCVMKLSRVEIQCFLFVVGGDVGERLSVFSLSGSFKHIYTLEVFERIENRGKDHINPHNLYIRITIFATRWL